MSNSFFDTFDQRRLKGAILFRRPFRRPFEPSTGPPQLRGHMPLRKQRVEIAVVDDKAVLREWPAAARERQRCQAVVLCHDEIAGPQPVYQCEIDTVGACGDNDCFSTWPLESVSGIAEQQAIESVPRGETYYDIHDWAGVRIHQNPHIQANLRRNSSARQVFSSCSPYCRRQIS